MFTPLFVSLGINQFCYFRYRREIIKFKKAFAEVKKKYNELKCIRILFFFNFILINFQLSIYIII